MGVIHILLFLTMMGAVYTACPEPKIQFASYPTRASIISLFMHVCSDGASETECTIEQWNRVFQLYGSDADVLKYGNNAEKIVKYCTEDGTTFNIPYMLNRCSCFASSMHLEVLTAMNGKKLSLEQTMP